MTHRINFLTAFQAIRRSYTIQLTLWVSGFVLAISVIVIFLLARYSQEVIRDESVDAAQQTLENIALRINTNLRLTEMTAKFENNPVHIDKAYIDHLLSDGNYVLALNQTLPHARLTVTDSGSIDHTGLQDDHQQFLFKEPVYNGQYHLVITVPATDIYSRFTGMQIVLLRWGTGGVLAIILILWWIIAHHLRPLHLLADSSQRIADGHLNEAIPDSKQKDEIGQLQNSLSKMQLSLAAYMKEMQQDQDVLSRQIDALQSAYSQTQAYENLKEKVLSDMSDKMSVPVAIICRHTDDICHNYSTLSPSKMAQMQVEIQSATESIVRLLEQLLNKI